ncbi:ATP-binding protein [Halapricum hydrolyticum]|uniref:histidine kinase n=1 Tax=Halapricum hydrolyticum TaxID=2979991 RepID=A0AAE3IA64_9EURY|nr:ATP-binding protein [Halapricum hydrolyticum]MCU4717369.1 response regulator [Halapricum hydrolyticum]MCU4726296.1 response regulator [Halapricum hydrolyticum]
MSNRSGIRVLHVDDELDFADLTADYLERTDDRFTVVSVTDPNTGLDRLDKDDFDCIVSDYAMPGMNGLEFLEAVRDEDPELPFVLFTGQGSEEVASEAIAAGATDYLQKGGSIDQYELLANRIRNAVEQYRSRKRAATLTRLRSLAGDITQALVRAQSRDEVETRVCERISTTDPYTAAWIGTVNPETGRVESRTTAGHVDPSSCDATITADIDSLERELAETALRERRVAVSQDIARDSSAGLWKQAAVDSGVRSAAAVPLTYDDTQYGALVVYADDPELFDEDERALLSELGSDIGHATHSLEIEAQLRAERDRREALFTNAPTPVLESRPQGEKHVIVAVNDAFESVFGINREDAVGNPGTDVHIPQDASDRHAEIRERTEAGETVTFEIERDTADGRREFVTHAVPHGTDEEGPDGFYVWYTDVTEQRRREWEQSALREQILFALETTRSIIWTVTLDDGEFEFYGLSDIFGRLDIDDWEDFLAKAVHPKDRAKVARQYRTVERGETDEFVVEYRTNPASGDTRWLRSEGYVRGTDAPRVIVGLTTDVTSQKEHEQALQRQNERLNQFANVISHDLRNPLHVAQGHINLTRQGCDSDSLDDAADAIDRGLALVDDVLALAREENPASGVEPVDLEEVVTQCWETVMTSDATLTVETGHTIDADPGRLKQVFENLFRNAVEHAGGDVTITVGDLDDGFYVEDNGPGIPNEDRDDVFEPGYSTAGEGTGFGLAIVNEIADAHNWAVQVTDSETGGARFEITDVRVKS